MPPARNGSRACWWWRRATPESGAAWTCRWRRATPLRRSRPVPPAGARPVGGAAEAGRCASPWASPSSGGLILNLMPCVLPVLSLKVLGFVRHGRGARRRSLASRPGLHRRRGRSPSGPWRARCSCCARAASRWAGASSSSRRRSWSCCPACSCSWPEPVRRLRGRGVARCGAAERPDGAQRPRASFWNGALATMVATPCTAPFMGSALGFALEPARLGGASRSSPPSAWAWRRRTCCCRSAPGLLRFVPKPGPWMETLQAAHGLPAAGHRGGSGLALRPAGRCGRRWASCSWRFSSPPSGPGSTDGGADGPPGARRAFAAVALGFMAAGLGSAWRKAMPPAAAAPAAGRPRAECAWEEYSAGAPRRATAAGQAGLHRLHRRLVSHLPGQRARGARAGPRSSSASAARASSPCAPTGRSATTRSPTPWQPTAARACRCTCSTAPGAPRGSSRGAHAGHRALRPGRDAG